MKMLKETNMKLVVFLLMITFVFSGCNKTVQIDSNVQVNKPTSLPTTSLDTVSNKQKDEETKINEVTNSKDESEKKTLIPSPIPTVTSVSREEAISIIKEYFKLYTSSKLKVYSSEFPNNSDLKIDNELYFSVVTSGSMPSLFVPLYVRQKDGLIFLKNPKDDKTVLPLDKNASEFMEYIGDDYIIDDATTASIAVCKSDFVIGSISRIYDGGRKVSTVETFYAVGNNGKYYVECSDSWGTQYKGKVEIKNGRVILDWQSFDMKEYPVVGGKSEMYRKSKTSEVFKGTIGNELGITMKCTMTKRDDNSIIILGSYHYDKIGKEITITGKVDENSNLNIIERAYEDKSGSSYYQITGIFSGKYESDSIQGMWKSPDNKAVYPFSLKKY